MSDGVYVKLLDHHEVVDATNKTLAILFSPWELFRFGSRDSRLWVNYGRPTKAQTMSVIFLVIICDVQMIDDLVEKWHENTTEWVRARQNN